MFSIVNPGYRLRYGREAKGPHEFCGSHGIAGAMCPNCRKPLLRLVQLSALDPVLAQLGGEMPLLTCWTCHLVQAPYSYRVGTNEVKLIEYRRGGAVSDFPYEAYPLAFPLAPAHLEPLEGELIEATVRVNGGRPTNGDLDRDWDRPRHQVGGLPIVQSQGGQNPSCPECGKAMPFLASIADDTLDPRGFTGNSFVQLFFFVCTSCRVVAAEQDVD